MSKAIVTYFSASGVTAKAAMQLADALGCGVYEIVPKVPYTDEDLNWMNSKSRSSLEMKGGADYPELADTTADFSAYDTVFVGFPIWWYVAPTIINRFLETYDFSGKKIILFATSGGSGFGKTAAALKKSAPAAEIVEGKLLNGMSAAEIKAWADSLGI